MATKIAEFRRVLDLAPHLDGLAVVAHGICYDGTLAVLATNPAAEELPSGRVEQPGWASFPRSRSEAPYPITFLRFGSELAGRIEIPLSESAFPYVQVFPDDSILIVSARSKWTSDGPELNACVYTKHGELSQRFCLGDGINDVQISAGGQIWVAYCDEGVFGNFGWSEPLGYSGLCCFNANGTIAWTFEPPADLNSIIDCYAMNVAGGSVWACYYSDFPVVRITDDNKHVTGWKNEIAGADAIASDGNRVLLYGGYDADKTRCVLQTLGTDGTMHDQTTYSLVLPSGAEQASITGRGSELHLLVNSNWYVLSLSDLVLL